MPFSGAGSGGGGGIGSSTLLYRFTVTGSAKASIDTGVDTAQAGSNVWTNGDVLMVWLMGQTTEVATTSVVNFTFNNDSAAHYDEEAVTGIGAVASAAGNTALSNMPAHIHGNTGTTGYPGVIRMSVPAFTLTTFNKVVELTYGVPDGTAGNQMAQTRIFGWRSTSAVTRLAVAPNSGNFAVGTQLLIYNLTAS